MSVRIDHDLLTQPQRKMRKHLERASEYVRTAGWLIGDFFGVARWQVVPVIACGIAHIGLKFAAMGAIYLGVHALSEDAPVAIPGLTFVSPKSPEFIALSVGVGVAPLIGTAFFRYQVRRRVISLGRYYEERCARRIVLLASRLPDPRAGVASTIVRSGSLSRYPGYGRFCGMAVRQLTQLLPTFASFLAVSLALLWMDAGLTVTLAALAAIAVLAQYPANHRVATASKVLESTRSAAGRRYRALFRRLYYDPTPLAPDGAIVDQLFRSGHVRDNIDSVSARAAEAEHAALVSRISSSVLLGVTLVLLGIDIVQGERTWAGVAAYAAAVRFALSDFVSVCKIASGMTKYHAQIAKHREFVMDALPCLRDARGEALAESVLIVIHSRPNSIGRHGERAAIVSDGDALRGWLPVPAGAKARDLLGFSAQITRTLAATGADRSHGLDEDDPDD